MGVGHLIYELARQRIKKREKKEAKKEKDTLLPLYKRYCGKKKKEAPRELEEAVSILGWDLDARCIPSASMTLAFVAFMGLAALIPLYAIYLIMFEGYSLSEIPAEFLFELSGGNFFLISLLLLPLIGFFTTYFALYYYPIALKDRLLKEILPTLPETLGYVVLSMKLTPNLERALEFAGQNGRGRLAEEFKRLVWEVRMGMHTSTEEAVDRLAYKWGRFLPEVKHALMRVRGAVLEPDEARRSFRLDETLKEVIESVKDKMLDLASKMYMPSVQLFYLGVFLPLLLFIILPVGAAFTDMPLATLPSLVITYLIVLPAVTYAFARSILERRPSFYEPPVPPTSLVQDYLRIRRKAMAVSALLTVASLVLGYYLHLNLDLTYDRVEILYCGAPGCLRKGYTTWEEALQDPTVAYVISSYDTTPYWLVFGVFLGITAATGSYLFITRRPQLQLQKRFEEMEGEFKDTVYLLASRMGEGKPLEGALDALLEFMPEALIVKEVFSRVIYNIKALGLSLRDALFDPLFGALRDVPSKFLRRAMSIVVKAVELGTEMASKALLSYSEQLRYEEEIVQSLKNKMSEIYTMMLSMAVLVGPVILGITIALQQVIIKSLMSVQAPQLPEDLALKMGISVPEMSLTGKNMASPLEFLIVVFSYNLILTSLLTYYAVRIYEGKNRPRLLLSLGRNLIISAALFIVTAWLSLSLVKGMLE